LIEFKKSMSTSEKNINSSKLYHHGR
jgi:hypothetical protein